MANWIKNPLILEGTKVKLLPLEEKHFDELINCSREEIIWTYMPVKGTDKEKLSAALHESLVQKELGDQYPFIVVDKQTNEIIGSTRFLKITEEHKNLEIGYTWYKPSYWGKGYNEECKLLLLTHCFEELKTIRVQIITSHINLRSRKAIERIGAQFEGVLRNVIIRNGNIRSTAYYSIIDEEWIDVKELITGIYKDKYTKH